MVAPALGRPTLIGVHLHQSDKHFPGVPSSGRFCVPARPTIIITHHPRVPKLTYGYLHRGCLIWGLGSFSPSPCAGRPTILGVFRRLFHGEKYPLSPRTKCPSLTMIPISPLLCTRLRSDGVGSAVDSTLSHIPSPVVPYGVILLVYRYSIVFVVVVALKISTLCTSYHQLSPLNHKVLFVSFFACYI